MQSAEAALFFFSRVQLLCSMVVERREAKQGQRQRQKQRHACLFFWNRAGNLQLGLAASSVLHRSNRCCGHPSEVVDWTGNGRNRGKRGTSHLSRMQLHMYACCVCACAMPTSAGVSQQPTTMGEQQKQQQQQQQQHHHQ